MKKIFLRRNRKAGVNVGRAVLFCVYRKKDFLVLTAGEIFEDFFCVEGKFLFLRQIVHLWRLLFLFTLRRVYERVYENRISFPKLFLEGFWKSFAYGKKKGLLYVAFSYTLLAFSILRSFFTVYRA
jgi:hypothetical protein